MTLININLGSYFVDVYFALRFFLLSQIILNFSEIKKHVSGTGLHSAIVTSFLLPFNSFALQNYRLGEYS